MSKRVPRRISRAFAVASVVAVPGIMLMSAGSGCSSSKSDAPTTGIPTEAGAGVARVDAPVEASGPSCPPADPIDATKLPSKPPAIKTNSCTTADLTDFAEFVEGNDDSSTWKASIKNSTCRSCIYGLETAATWAPIVENGTGELVQFNVGGCIAMASGNDACGKAYQQEFECRNEACGDCSPDTASFQKCGVAARNEACKAAVDAVRSICGTKLDAAETACTEKVRYVFEGPIKAQCIGGIGDAGPIAIQVKPTSAIGIFSPRSCSSPVTSSMVRLRRGPPSPAAIVRRV